jgi:hypothetical protein
MIRTQRRLTYSGGAEAGAEEGAFLGCAAEGSPCCGAAEDEADEGSFCGSAEEDEDADEGSPWGWADDEAEEGAGSCCPPPKKGFCPSEGFPNGAF